MGLDDWVGLTFTDWHWAAIARRVHASPQQARIMRLALEHELKTAAIAHRLGLATRATGGVETQLQRLYAKLGVHSRVGLAWRVFQEVLRMREEHRSEAES